MRWLLITHHLSSPESLPASRWSQCIHRSRWEPENGACCLHREDEVDVGDHHHQTGQEGKAKTKTTDAAAEGCSHPVNQPATQNRL